ncbi:MAG: hypothetical protein RL228_1315 [Actinomycetota bacterium]|jgi:aryl-alcohol dehydrogenase-like predicted oxidoreductase
MLTIPETDLVVHPLCLGGNVFGWTAGPEESHDVLSAYASHGGNFIATADVYSEWKPGNKGGESETIIGTWLKSQERSKFVVATKVAKLSTRPGLRPENIIAACNDSLQRLQTDYIDIYYSHHDDHEVPMAETLGAYAQLISEGKVPHTPFNPWNSSNQEDAHHRKEGSGQCRQPRHRRHHRIHGGDIALSHRRRLKSQRQPQANA